MGKKQKIFRPKARIPKGLRDIPAAAVRAEAAMLARIREVYEAYGFEPLETSAFEYADALGKFLPDADRPNEGVFSLQDDDEQWLSLRYDLTAPLARYVAEHYDGLPKPFRRYQTGPVWRNEKPGPGRFRQFTQFDADTVGAPTVAADAELCMMAADCLEALGIPRGSYVMRVNNRKVLDGVFENAGITGEGAEFEARHLTVMRAIDKLDRLGPEGVRLLLGKGRKDESGDFTEGAHLSDEQIDRIMAFTGAGGDDRAAVCARMGELVGDSARGLEGVAEMRLIDELLSAGGYGADRVAFDPSVVRGLGYYTGPVFEAELTFEAETEDGRMRFGSVGGGGRYDDLVERFKGVKVPATGFSIGVSRLYAALEALGKLETETVLPPVIVLTMDNDRLADYQRMVMELRAAGIRAEMYLGGSGMRAQVKYADKRGAPCVVIEGEDERAAGEVTIKDLILGAQKAEEITDNTEWRESAHAQISVPRAGLVGAVKDVLARHTAAR
ncbi:histidyl-tRNA synthetase [Tepidicaulis marinus]|uniref:Histidine--tRNA ligase n=1 Tax=Tepidicaulis marinus TaxID=1333998 RepID=A0A081BA48_9HYPH|nr:histidine--tRNA ligase [Tepidicaulis marinus]GAK44916.1 histidyl-tRNA synthetase [Tepidicaulis marinus]